MSVKLEVEFEDKASSVADKIASKLDVLADRVEKVHDKQATAAEREAARASRAQEREANRALKAQTRAAEKATAAAEREAEKQAKAAEHEASRAIRAAEHEAQAKIRAVEKEARATERARSRQLRASREADRERMRRTREEKRASAEVIKRRKQEHKASEDAAKDGFWWNFKANLAANAAGKLLEGGGAALSAVHNLGKDREQQGFIFDSFSEGVEGNLGEDYLDHANALAERFGLNLEETRIKYQRLLGLKESPQQIDTLIRLGADLEATGRSSEYVSEIYDAINQIAIKEKGTFADIGTEAISRIGVTDKDMLASLAKELGRKSATHEDLNKFFGKDGASSAATERLLIGAVQNSLGVENPGELARKRVDETLDGVEDRAMVKATLIGERFSEGLLNAIRPSFLKVADWINGLDGDKAESWGHSLAQMFGLGENTDAQKQWIAEKGARQAAGADNKVTLSDVGNGALGLGEKVWDVLGLGGPKAAARGESIGAQMGAGLVKGLDGQAGPVAEAGARLTETAAAAGEKQVEINSPSKRLERDGEFAGEGLAIGLDKSARGVEDAANRMFEPLLGAPEVSAEGLAVTPATEAYPSTSPQVNPSATFTEASGATVQVTAPISIVVGGDGQTSAAVMSEFRRSLRRDVETMFEEVALQLGASP